MNRPSTPARRLAACSAGLATVLVAPFSLAQTAPTQLWVDVSTSTFAGMPEFMQSGSGFLGGLMGKVTGSSAALRQYGYASGRFIQQGTDQSRMGGGMPPTRVVDVALLNPRRPGVEAALAIPPGMRMGEALPLVPPNPGEREAGDADPGKPPEIKGRILVYWGCSPTVRPGQPRIANFGGDPAKWAQVLAGRHAPERAARVGAQHALYPNEKNQVNPSAESSLQGEHRVQGEGVPESMGFTLGPGQDLMPSIQLQSQGAVTDSIQLRWEPVDRAHAYHLHAMGMVGDDMVLWSSSEIADAGLGLFDYLGESTTAKWVRDKLLLPASAAECAVPKGIFAGDGAGRSGEAGAAMLRMIAYGPESHFSHPARPAKPPAGWKPEWTVRVRTKSQTMAMLGVDMTGMAAGQRAPGGSDREGDESTGQRPEPQAPGAINILRGLFGR